ncbi:MAG TPA: WG repeat-containing protein [Saprospiraceae bacterium]|nr:WG repeat-containing protein [Saprospiraceae bacterium]
MKLGFIFLAISMTLFSCDAPKSNPIKKTSSLDSIYHDLDLSKIDTTDYLVRKSKENTYYELGVPFAFVDKRNDTIIPTGKYYATWTDTLKTFAIVSKNSEMIGIDRNENLLFSVFFIDNGPDYVVEGLFRVMRNGKIGYANKQGEIVIPCQFDCAYYFENGKAKVSNNCKRIKEGEYHRWISDDWYYIDKQGNRIN